MGGLIRVQRGEGGLMVEINNYAKRKTGDSKDGLVLLMDCCLR